MDRRYFIFLGLITLCWACQEPELKVPMNMPNDKPFAFNITAGLPSELKEKKVIFEQYRIEGITSSEAIRLYANGDFYEIYCGSRQSFKEDSISWRKMGHIPPSDMGEILKISKNGVVHYLNDGPHEIVGLAASNMYWYFYFDKPKFVHTQGRMFQWPWNQKPSFARKIDAILHQNRKYENLLD